MNRHVVLTLFVALLVAPALGRAAAIVLQPQEKNLAAEQQEASRFIDDLAKGKSTGAPGRQVSYGAPAESKAAIAPYRGGPLDFKKAGKSAYQTNETLDAMTAMSLAGLQAMGTPGQGAAADRLSAYGQQLSRSGNPALAQAGGNLQDQAAAMNSGDLAGATNASQNLQSMPHMGLPSGYRASQADLSWGGAMTSIGTDFMASFAGAAGQAAMSALGTILTNYFSKGSKNTVAAQSLGNLGGALGPGIVRGTNSPGHVAAASGSIATLGGSAAGRAVVPSSGSSSSGGSHLPGPLSSGSNLPGPGGVNAGSANTVINPQGAGSVTGNVLPGSGQ